MPPLPERIEYRNGAALVAEVTCSADGVLAAAYDAQGGQVGYAQVATDGSLTLTGGGGTTARIEANGDIVLDPGSNRIRLENLPTTDPAYATQVWNDGGTVKVSAG